MTSGSPKPRPPASLFALGHDSLPQSFSANGVTYEFVELFKHDFFAATGLYRITKVETTAFPVHVGDLAVLKVQRIKSFYGFPMCWLGRYVANREFRICQKLQGIRGIPMLLGRVGRTGFVHAFIPGSDLHARKQVSAQFFHELEVLLAEIHSRKVAYVDTNKRENILVGDDGHPWLIDFQISADRRWWNPFSPFMVSRFIKADWYHFYKHKTRMIPEACSPADFEKAQRRGMLHEMHRRFSRPFIRIRRKWLSRYDLAKTR